MDIIRNNAVNYTVFEFGNRKDWLLARKGHIGASDASAVLGLCPWRTNVQLWEEKMSDEEPVEIINPNIERGIKSEPHIRELYAIESGDSVQDGTGIMLVSNEHPFMSCTLDGACIDKDGKPYILEIKSVNWTRKWSRGNSIPDYYFIQLLHQMVVTGWDKAVLLARIIMPSGDEVVTRKYIVNRGDVKLLMDGLIEKESEFAKSIEDGIRPNLIIPIPSI